jgi:spoIIIJ-associated protein
MTAKMHTFKGKDVPEAINKACESLKVSQDQLDIEVVNTGSAGIFGLCRQKSIIKVTLKKESATPAASVAAPGAQAKGSGKKKPSARPTKPKTEKITTPPVKKETVAAPPPPSAVEVRPAADLRPAKDFDILTDDEREAIRADISKVLDLMGFPSTVTLNQEEESLLAHIDGEHVSDIIGEEGRTLDSLQYLLRKIFSKKFAAKIILNLDAGDFRAHRLEDLTKLGLKYAAEVKETGKTRAIPSLNPSERRVVHMALQDDKEIRSRSVGEGLFKKVLIYQPAKGKKNVKKRRTGKPAQT